MRIIINAKRGEEIQAINAASTARRVWGDEGAAVEAVKIETEKGAAEFSGEFLSYLESQTDQSSPA